MSAEQPTETVLTTGPVILQIASVKRGLRAAIARDDHRATLAGVMSWAALKARYEMTTCPLCDANLDEENAHGLGI